MSLTATALALALGTGGARPDREDTIPAPVRPVTDGASSAGTADVDAGPHAGAGHVPAEIDRGQRGACALPDDRAPRRT